MYKIYKISDDPTVDFAASELKKYLRMMMPRCGEIPISRNSIAQGGFRLGLFCDMEIPTTDIPSLALDDVIHVDTDSSGGIIAGSNPRSVLLAVYCYLKKNGCRWLFSGIDGEYIPIKEIEPVSYHHMADNRYRGQCNEGSTAQQNYLDAIDFIPKIGMNIYMLEFDIPSYYYNSWYNHDHNTAMKPEPVSKDTILQWKRQCECEIKKRGLQYHDMGHGWTAEPFGFDSTDAWNPSNAEKFTDVQKQSIAQIGGKRKFFGGMPINTNVCMSNPSVRETIAKYVANYAKVQNNVDFLHIWLADASNNHCECENCRKKDTSDWYIILLNDIDRELIKNRLDTHLVFIAYYDTTWQPKTEKLIHPDRFSMLFAPHSRTYTESFEEDADMSQYVPYNRNKLVLPRGIGGCLCYLNKWKESFSGDCFVYEYHFWRMQAFEPSYQHLAKLIYKDIHGLKKHGLSGIIEDSTPRNYMPSGFAQTLFGEALFDLSLSYEEIEHDYMSHAFGSDWKKLTSLLDKLYDERVFKMISEPKIDKNTGLRDYRGSFVSDVMDKWHKVCDEIDLLGNSQRHFEKRPQSVLWKNLSFFTDLVRYDAKLLSAKAAGDDAGACQIAQQAMEDLGSRELSVQPFYDLGLWGRSFRAIYNQRNAFPDVP